MIHIRIVTPERIVTETEVDSVSLPTPLGEITVLTNHIPLVSNLTSGEIRYKKDNKEEILAVSGGFIEVKENNQVVVLADTAEYGHEIDVIRAHEAAKKAREAIKTATPTEKPLAATAILQKHLARVRVHHKHHSRNKKMSDLNNS
jgi:F-type H+-transporting ATPase subunit epsilon